MQIKIYPVILHTGLHAVGPDFWQTVPESILISLYS